MVPVRRHGSASRTHWAALTVEDQEADPGSTLRLYRDALRLRRTESGLGDGPFEWLPSRPRMSSRSRRGDRFVSITNLSREPIPLTGDFELLLASSPIVDGRLPVDATAWLRRDDPSASLAWPGGDTERSHG